MLQVGVADNKSHSRTKKIDSTLDRWENFLTSKAFDALEKECAEALSLDDIENSLIHPHALFFLVRMNEERGELSKAHAISSKLINKLQNEQVYMLHGRLCYKLGFYDDAEKVFEAVANANSEQQEAGNFLRLLRKNIGGPGPELPREQKAAKIEYSNQKKTIQISDYVPFLDQHRVLMIATYPPALGHAGGLRMLDIIRLLKQLNPSIYLEVYTSSMKDLCGPIDLVYALADRVLIAEHFDFSLEGYLQKAQGDVRRFDIIDFQFPQPLDVIQSYRKVGKKIIFTPMESHIRNDIIEGNDEFGQHALLEKEIVNAVDCTVCVSDMDRKALLGHVEGKVVAIETGISEIEFSLQYDTRIAKNSVCYVAYFGSETNRLALKWYLDNVHDLVIDQVPDYKFYIIGKGPVGDILSKEITGVIYVGEVERIAPHIAMANVGIAPAFSGSGFRGKINQYSRLKVPCVASPLAANGLKYIDGESILIADTASQFAHSIISILSKPELHKKLASAANLVSQKYYSWNSKKNDIRDVYNVPKIVSPTDLPSVRVLVPSWQHGRYLENRIRSIFAQEYSNFKVTVIDDASDDSSIYVLEKLNKEFTFELIVNQENTGSPFASWRYLAESAKEDLIWICESDDVAHPMFLNKMVKLIRSRPNIKLAYCGSQIIDENNKIIDDTDARFKKFFHPERWSRTFVADGLDELKQYQRFGMTVPNMSSALIDRLAFKSALSKDLGKFRLVGDWLLVGRVMQLGEVAYLPDKLNFFRFHSETARFRTTEDRSSAEHLLAHFYLSKSIDCNEAEILEAMRPQMATLFSNPIRIKKVVDEMSIIDNSSAVYLDDLVNKFYTSDAGEK